MPRRLLLLFLALISLPLAARAQGIEPSLLAEGPAPRGGQVELAIRMHPAPGWHGYWLNPGDAGLPMNVEWQLPKGVSVGPLRYPVPRRLTVAGLMNYVFDRDYAVLVSLSVPADTTGMLPIRAHARWLACTDKICVPQQSDLSLDLPVGNGTPNRAEFDAWRQKLAQPLATPGRFAVTDHRLDVAIPLPASIDLRQPYVFPVTDNIVDYEAPQTFRRVGDWLVGELRIKQSTPTFAGVLETNDGRGLAFSAMPGPVPEGGTPVGGLGTSAVLWALVGAIAGGILLNLMPCVFPILALKALHLSRASGEPGEARRDALAYTIGAVVGTGALGAVLLAVRAAGAQAGWAFQLQDPRTIILLLLLAIAITLNLLGVFELPVLGGRAQPAGSFGSGALAAFVATPCAGPFLGAALGTALLLPLALSIAVFAALGLGLALPFLVIAFVPVLRRWLPRPGRWMERLKQFLAIPMAASAAAALWLLYRQAGVRGLLVGVLVSFGLAVGAIAAGRRQRTGSGELANLALAGLGLLIVAIVLLPGHSSGSHAISGAQRWSESALQTAVHDRRPVLVYFTADWCLTCKVNEAGAIDSAAVRDAFKRKRVVVLAGDWTNGDPVITRFLERFGRAGVPFYIWYAPGKPPEELPQMLTPEMLTSRANALKQ